MKQQRGTDDDIDEAAEVLELVERYLTDGSILNVDTGYQVPADDAAFVAELRKIWNRRFGTNWRRVVYGFETLVKNVCDPDQPVLELRPDYKKALEFPRDVSAVLDRIGHPARGRRSFTRALGDRAALLSRLCAYADRRGADRGESPVWIVCKILKLSYALSMAVYEMYRADPPPPPTRVEPGPPCSVCGDHLPLVGGVCVRCRDADTVVMIDGPTDGG